MSKTEDVSRFHKMSGGFNLTKKSISSIIMTVVDRL